MDRGGMVVLGSETTVADAEVTVLAGPLEPPGTEGGGSADAALHAVTTKPRRRG